MYNFLEYVTLYSFLKLLRILTAATVFMTVALIVCQTGGRRGWRRNLLLSALVPSAVLTGYSRIFYTGKIFLYTNWLQQSATKNMAAGYFAVAGILALRYSFLYRKLRRNLKSMQLMRQEDCPHYLRRRGRYGIQVYLTKARCSPFAGGILRPYIVVPEYLQNMLSKEELSAVLYHETVHIRHGHVLLLNIYAVLKILWWVHPLVYILDKKLRENMEYSSDEISSVLGPLDVSGYAKVMLKTARIERQCFATEGITAFSDSCYAVLKRRMERLVAFQQQLHKNKSAKNRYQKKLRNGMAAAAVIMISVSAAILAASYPRYTVLDEIAVYDEEMNLLTYDLEAEGFWAEAAPDTFFISSGQMQKLAAAYKPKGDYVVFGYGTIMKVPGCGGLGQAALVSIEDVSKVSLLGRQAWTDQLKTFILKYLI